MIVNVVDKDGNEEKDVSGNVPKVSAVKFDGTGVCKFFLPKTADEYCLNVIRCHNESGKPVNVVKRLDVVVFVIVIEEEQILLVTEPKRKGGGLFLPAGHVEKKETLIEAALRETKEEAGIDVEIRSCVAVKYFFGQRYSPLHFVVEGRRADKNQALKSVADNESQKAEFYSLKKVCEDLDLESEKDEVHGYRKAWETRQILKNVLNDKILKKGIPIVE